MGLGPEDGRRQLTSANRPPAMPGSAASRPRLKLKPAGRLRDLLLFIVRSSSEDVVTDHIVMALRLLNPRWWLHDLLNQALGARRFDRQFYQRLRIEPWCNQTKYPRTLLP